MLSHCSLASSTASTYSCSTSVAGDDQSSISSSSSSQSDVSYGGRPPFWVEPSNRPHLSNETASSSSTLKALTGPDDRLYAAVMGSPGTHPSSSQLHSRGLNDSGRQSSLDSGIGITAGSQSSYSGSFFSYAGSLDTGSQGGGEEFGSVSSLPASLPSSLPPSTPPPPPPQSTLTPKHSSSTSTCNSRSSSCASHGCREEHQTPSLLRLLGYDSPRNVLHTPSMRDPFNQKSPPELCSESKTNSPTGPVTHHQTVMQHSHSRGSERMPSVESEGRCIPRPWLLPREEETQLVPGLDTENYITTEQWQSARNRCLTQVTDSQTGLSPSAHTQDSHLCVREEQDDVSDRLAGVKRSSQAPSARPPLPAALSTYRPSWACGTFQSSHPSALLDTGLRSDSSLNYVNIPTSRLPAKSNGELLYTALDLQGPSSTPFSSPHSAVRDEMYVHLDITAMETAQRVGAEHVQARENRLTELGGQARRAGALTPQRTTR